MVSQEAVLGVVCGAVEAEGQTGVEVGVVAHHGLDELHVVGVVVEDLVVGYEADEGAVLLGGAFPALVLFQYTFGIGGAPPSAVPPCRHLEIYRGGIDRLDTYTVESLRSS